jgi:hypothetical protein
MFIHMIHYALTLTCLLGLSSALIIPPNPLHARAGGPAIVPLPPTCTLTSPLPTTPIAPRTWGLTEQAIQSLLYQAYYGDGEYNQTKEFQMCSEQCYGYGLGVECKAAFWAEKLIVPKGYYNSPGGFPSVGCLLFTRPLTAEDFTIAPEGQSLHPMAGNLKC